MLLIIFFFHATATAEIYTLSLHDALPISIGDCYDDAMIEAVWSRMQVELLNTRRWKTSVEQRSEEHTSELQSHSDLVCRLLLEKKKKKKKNNKNKKDIEEQELYKMDIQLT